MVMNEKVQRILSCNRCQKIHLLRFNLSPFDSTVSAAECNDLKEQSLKDTRKLNTDDSIRDFTRIFEERVDELEGELTLSTESEQRIIRSVPFALEKQFKQELKKVTRDDIVEKLEGTSSLINSYLIERKQQKSPDMFRPQTIKQSTD